MLPRSLTLLVLLVSAPLVAAETLRFTADPSCPYVCQDPDHTDRLAARAGVIFETLDAIFDDQKYRISFEFLPYRRGLKMVRLGQRDALMVTLRDDAPALYYHQRPIAMARGCFVTRNDNSWQYEGIDSLEGICFGGTLGYKYGPLKRYIDENNSDTLMMAGDNIFERLLHMVQANRLDATIEDINVINYRLRQLNLTTSLRVAGCLSPGVPLYVGISPRYPGKAQLAELIDRRIGEFSGDGTLGQIAARYGLNDDIDKPKPNVRHP